jgi:hypothetical protein
MKRTSPPKTAAWLLQHFGSSPNNTEVIGDLAERYCSGKTALWYWRQVIIAIVVSAFDDIRTHKLLTLRAMIVGWCIYYFLGLSAVSFLVWFETKWPSLLNLGIALGPVVLLSIGTVSGAIIAILHRSNKRSLLLLFSLTVLLFWIRYSLSASVEDTGGFIYWEAYFWLDNGLQTLGILVGGLLVSSPKSLET